MLLLYLPYFTVATEFKLVGYSSSNLGIDEGKMFWWKFMMLYFEKGSNSKNWYRQIHLLCELSWNNATTIFFVFFRWAAETIGQSKSKWTIVSYFISQMLVINCDKNSNHSSPFRKSQKSVFKNMLWCKWCESTGLRTKILALNFASSFQINRYYF